MFNSHIHTNHSQDSAAPMEKMCLAAIEAGFSSVSITDHFNADFCVSNNAFNNVIQSVNEARTLSEKYKDQLAVYAGVEISDALRKPDYTARLLKTINPDSVIISVHNVFMNNMPQNLARTDFEKMTDGEAYEVIKVYFRELVRVAEKMDYDILAHLTLPLRYTNGVYGKKLSLGGFSKEIESILRTLIQRQKALEINTSDVFRQLYDFMPGKDIIAKYYGMGGRLVTIGTDAHSPERIDSGFKEAKALLKEIGFDSYCYYKNRKPVPVKL